MSGQGAGEDQASDAEHLRRDVNSQDVVAGVAAVAIDVRPCLAEKPAGVAGLGCAPLDRQRSEGRCHFHRRLDGSAVLPGTTALPEGATVPTAVQARTRP
jgi:hypothetical protein